MDFQQALEQGYLQVEAYAAGAGDLVRRWRAFCRERRVPCISIALTGPTAQVEVRLPHSSPFVSSPLDELVHHPLLPNSGGGSGGRTQVTLRDVRSESPARIAHVLHTVIGSHYSEERRLAARRATLSPQDAFVVRCELFMQPAPVIRMQLPDEEYAVVGRVLAHLGSDGPVALSPHTAHRLWPREHRLLERFSKLEKQTVAAWTAVQGPYRWQEHFPPEIAVLNESDFQDARPMTSCGRPGIDPAGRQALLWILHQNLRGFALLQKKRGKWLVVEVSHDEDWERAEFEPQEPWIPPDECHWEYVPMRYPQPEEEFFEPWSRIQSHRLYEQLCKGKGPKELAALEIIPTLHGSPLSLRQLLMLGQDRRELFWDEEPNEVTRGLAQQGHQVIEWSSRSPAWLGKLLFYLRPRFYCGQASRVFGIALETETGEALELVRSIFRRAGLPLEVGLCKSGPFLLQTAPGALGRRECGGSPFRMAGARVLIAQDTVNWVHTAPFRLMAELCKWGDPEGEWTDRLWHAAGVETS